MQVCVHVSAFTDRHIREVHGEVLALEVRAAHGRRPRVSVGSMTSGLASAVEAAL